MLISTRIGQQGKRRGRRPLPIPPCPSLPSNSPPLPLPLPVGLRQRRPLGHVGQPRGVDQDDLLVEHGLEVLLDDLGRRGYDVLPLPVLDEGEAREGLDDVLLLDARQLGGGEGEFCGRDNMTTRVSGREETEQGKIG